MKYLLLMPLLPLALGLALALLPLKKLRALNAYVISAVLLGSLACASAIFFAGDEALALFSLAENMPLLLKADGAGRLFAGLTAAVWPVVTVYAAEYMAHEQHQRRFYVFWLLVFGLLELLFFSGNLLTMYLFFEFVTLASVPLVLNSLTPEAISAGLKYLFYSIAGALLGLFGVFFLSAQAGSLDFIPGGSLQSFAGALPAAVFVMILGFGTKAGMFPMHGWLPAAHPVAPSPASAVLSGVITKAGVFAVFRAVYYVVGAERLRGTWVQTAWIIVALLTVFMGSMLAYREKLLKKRLAYSSVSQLSYIMLGLALLNAESVEGAALHVLVHSLAKDALFLCAGIFIMRTGKTLVADLRGVGRRLPVATGCFALLSLVLTGIPPTGGFLSKWYLAAGALSSGTGPFEWIAPAVLLLSALLTAGYLFPIWINGFFPGEGFAAERLRESPAMTVPVALLTAGAVAIGVFPAPLTDFISRFVGALM